MRRVILSHRSLIALSNRRLYSTGRSRITPFTREELSRLRTRLSPTLDCERGDLPPHTVSFAKKQAAEAAILIPLMNIDDEPHVLLEVRAAHMRSHAGEIRSVLFVRDTADISFPGGKIDADDHSIAGAALRETYEELGIPPDNVEILGMLGPEYSLGNRARVWPVVGFIHSQPDCTIASGQTLPSQPLPSLVKSPNEVSAILPFPLSALHDHHRRSIHHFRVDSQRPYYRWKAGDLVHPKMEAELELWGLSGWFLNVLAWRLGWLDKLVPETYEG